jgi:hypothetical protein
MLDNSRFAMSGRVLSRLMVLGLMTAGTTESADASLLWDWSYSGPGISAQGTFTTVDTPDSLGFYLITGITGVRNGEIITGLQPAGTPIPGNEPYDVDNLVRAGTIQLTKNGFGYSTSGGNHANPFFADFFSPPVYLEFFSSPPFSGSGSVGPEDSELEIRFSATPVPEPDTAVLMGACCAVLILARRGRARPAHFVKN